MSTRDLMLDQFKSVTIRVSNECNVLWSLALPTVDSAQWRMVCLFKHPLATPPTLHTTYYVAATRMMNLIDKERPPSWQSAERQSHTTQALSLIHI